MPCLLLLWKFNQQIANSLSLLENVIILCGHYKGVDWRVREHLITREISIGDYVLTGGELPGAVVADAVVRLLPGVIGDEQSALSDSFQDGLLAPPVYSRPAEYKGWRVPDILLSGHEAKIPSIAKSTADAHASTPPSRPTPTSSYSKKDTVNTSTT